MNPLYHMPGRRVGKKTRFKRSVSRTSSYNPSWRSFKTKKKRVSFQRNPLINIRTPKLVVSYFHLWLAKVTYKLLFVLLIFGVFYFLFFSEWLQINNVVVEGNRNTDKKLILDVVEPYLHKKRLSFFPANNFFWIPSSRIEKEITYSFRRISGVEAKKIFPDTLSINIEEKKAVLLFCSGTGCTWVDEEGVSYNKSSYAEAVADHSDIVIVQDNSQKDLPLGEGITDSAYVDFANRLWRSFQDKTQKEISLLSTPLPSAQEIRAHTKEGWVVYFDTTISLDRSLELLDKMLNKELVEKQENIACLDYIDLRVADRLFYKLKDGCGTPPSPEGENTNGNANDNSQVTNNESGPNEANASVLSPPKENPDKDSKKKKKKR